jgi:hypothetical protein
MATNPKLKVENLYESALTDAVVSATGDVTLKLTVAPSEPFGGLVIEPDDAGKRETVIYHAKSGLEVSVYGVNRKNGNTHLSGSVVRMLNIAELFNLMSGMVSWTFFTFQRGPLALTVNGGPVAPGLTAPDADITVGNGTTYLWFKPSDSTVNSTQNESDIANNNGLKFATVVAGGGTITSIAYDRYITGSFLFSSMRDVAVGGATDGQLLAWDNAAQKWVPGARFFNLDDLLDVNTGTPTDGYVLAWDAGTSKYVLVQPEAGIVDAPSDGSSYLRKDGAWIVGTPEAPIDGMAYVRKDGAWVLETGGGSGGIPVEYKTSDFAGLENHEYVVGGGSTVIMTFPGTATVGSIINVFLRNGEVNIAGTTYDVPGTYVKCVCNSPSTWSRNAFFPTTGGIGTAGQVLKSNGPGNAPSFQAESGGGGGNREYVIQDYKGPAVVGILGVVDVTGTHTLVDITLVADSLPVGSNCVAELRKNSTTGSNVLSATLQLTTTDTLANGRYVGTAVTSFTSASIVTGDVLYLVVTDAGSTLPPTNLRAILEIS